MTLCPTLVTLRNGRRIEFEVDADAPGPAMFFLSVRKCGSTLITIIGTMMALMNQRNCVDVSKFFQCDVREDFWSVDPGLGAMLHAGNVYVGYRLMPTAIERHPVFQAGRKILFIRDPRDALVSEYFSLAYSHPIPERTETTAPASDMMEKLRRASLNADIDAFVIRRSRSMLEAFVGYLDTAHSPQTAIYRYEDYIFRKPELVERIATHFGWSIDDQHMQDIMAQTDRLPAQEDPTAFIRRVTPGDHLVKLRPETVAQLNVALRPVLDAFGYS